MDRLSALIVLAACGNDGKEPPAARNESAKVAAVQANTAEGFCEFLAKPEAPGPELTWAPLADGKQPPPPAKGWRWINLWATWCKPCVEELPRLAKWKGQLEGIDMQFVSLDDKPEDVEAFRKEHPGTPETFRIADAEKIDEWTNKLGLKGSPMIPIHVFVDPSNHVKCARAGNVREQDFAVIKQLTKK